MLKWTLNCLDLRSQWLPTPKRVEVLLGALYPLLLLCTSSDLEIHGQRGKPRERFLFPRLLKQGVLEDKGEKPSTRERQLGQGNGLKQLEKNLPSASNMGNAAMSTGLQCSKHEGR